MPDDAADGAEGQLQLPEEARRALEAITAEGRTGKVGVHVSKGRLVAIIFTGDDQSKQFLWGDAEAIRDL